MLDIFSDLLDINVIIYLDEILIYSDDPMEHTKHVHEVLYCLCKHGLFARPDKCHFSDDRSGYCVGMDAAILAYYLRILNTKCTLLIRLQPMFNISLES